MLRFYILSGTGWGGQIPIFIASSLCLRFKDGTTSVLGKVRFSFFLGHEHWLSTQWCHSRCFRHLPLYVVTGGRPQCGHTVTCWQASKNLMWILPHYLVSLLWLETTGKRYEWHIFFFLFYGTKSRILSSKHIEILVRKVVYDCKRWITAAVFSFCLLYAIHNLITRGLFGCFLDQSKKSKWKNYRNNTCWIFNLGSCGHRYWLALELCSFIVRYLLSLLPGSKIQKVTSTHHLVHSIWS